MDTAGYVQVTCSVHGLSIKNGLVRYDGQL